MKNLILSVCLIVSLAMVSSSSYAASAKCEAVEIDGDKIILNCGKDTKKFKTGSKIKIKSVKTKQIEGC